MNEPGQPEVAPSQPGEREKVTVPGILMEFLDRATVGIAGTRDANLKPHVHRISGWSVEPGGHAMTVLIPELFTKHLLSSLEDNGRIAVTIEEIGPHETYQFKGRYASSRPVNEEDVLGYQRLRDRFGKVVSVKFGIAEDKARLYPVEPNLAVTFEVEEIFLQTPGPGAGRRLVPSEDAR